MRKLLLLPILFLLATTVSGQALTGPSGYGIKQNFIKALKGLWAPIVDDTTEAKLPAYFAENSTNGVREGMIIRYSADFSLYELIKTGSVYNWRKLGGGGDNLYTADGTITSERTVNSAFPLSWNFAASGWNSNLSMTEGGMFLTGTTTDDTYSWAAGPYFHTWEVGKTATADKANMGLNINGFSVDMDLLPKFQVNKGTREIYFPDFADLVGDQVLATNSSGKLILKTPTGGTPGGADRSIQFNNGGAFGGAFSYTEPFATRKQLNLTSVNTDTGTVATAGAFSIRTNNAMRMSISQGGATIFYQPVVGWDATATNQFTTLAQLRDTAAAVRGYANTQIGNLDFNSILQNGDVGLSGAQLGNASTTAQYDWRLRRLIGSNAHSANTYIANTSGAEGWRTESILGANTVSLNLVPASLANGLVYRYGSTVSPVWHTGNDPAGLSTTVPTLTGSVVFSGLTFNNGRVTNYSTRGLTASDVGATPANTETLASVTGRGATTTTPLSITPSAASAWAMYVTNASTTNGNGIYASTAPASTGIPFRVDVGGVEKLVVNSAGRSLFNGIGDDGFGAIQSNGAIGSNSVIYSTNVDGISTIMQSSSGVGGGVIGTNSNHPLVFNTNGLGRGSVNTSGEWGFGNNPVSGYRAYFEGAVRSKGLVTLFGGSNTINTGVNFEDPAGGNGANIQLRATDAYGAKGLGFWTYLGAWGEKMTLASNGNLGIGTTTPAQKLVVSDGGVQGLEFIANDGVFSTIEAFNRSTLAVSPLALSGDIISLKTGGVERASMSATGETWFYHDMLIGNPTSDNGVSLQPSLLTTNIQGTDFTGGTPKDISMQVFGGKVSIATGTATSTLTNSGSVAPGGQRVVNTPTSFTVGDEYCIYISGFTTGGATGQTITLPDPNSCPNRVYVIIEETASQWNIAYPGGTTISRTWGSPFSTISSTMHLISAGGKWICTSKD